MSKSQIIIQRIIMVIALYYMFTAIIDKDQWTLIEAVIIYIYELFIMNWINKNRNKKEN